MTAPKKGGDSRPKADADKAEQVIFRRYITTRDGRRLDAWAYGLKAFRIRVSK